MIGAIAIILVFSLHGAGIVAWAITDERKRKAAK